MAKVFLSKTAIKDFRSLSPPAEQYIRKKLNELSLDPLKFSKKLSESKVGTYRFRCGDYRIIFDLEGDEIKVLRIGHRKDIYR